MDMAEVVYCDHPHDQIFYGIISKNENGLILNPNTFSKNNNNGNK